MKSRQLEDKACEAPWSQKTNLPLVVILSEMECCKKKCLQKFRMLHLEEVKSEFRGLYYESQNTYLHGLLHHCQTKKTSGHARKTHPSTSPNGKRLGRPPAEKSQFSFEYTIRNENGINVYVCQKAFCSVHGFGPKRLHVLRRKVQSGHGGPKPNKRGKHGCHLKVEDLKQLFHGALYAVGSLLWAADTRDHASLRIHGTVLVLMAQQTDEHALSYPFWNNGCA